MTENYSLLLNVFVQHCSKILTNKTSAGHNPGEVQAALLVCMDSSLFFRAHNEGFIFRFARPRCDEK
jgi:hypothetical protein